MDADKLDELERLLAEHERLHDDIANHAEGSPNAVEAAWKAHDARIELQRALLANSPELVAMGRRVAEMEALRRDAGNLATALSLGGDIEKVTQVLRIIESGGPHSIERSYSNDDWNFDMQAAPRQGEIDLVYLSSFDGRYHRAPGCKWGRDTDGDEGWLEYRRHPEVSYEDEWQLVPFEPVAWKAISLPTVAALKGT